MSGADKPTDRPLSWGERQEQRKQRAHRVKSPRVGRARGWWKSIRHMLGARAVIVVDGVRFHERSTITLRRALAETGPGVKEYRVRFRAGAERESMKIRLTRSRIYGDLLTDPRVRVYRQLIGQIRPGSRILELGCGTGSGSVMLSQGVGPSGGVVAINRDGESIRFARQRYDLANTGFELGWIETLAGEVDGAFDVVCAVDPLRSASDDPARSSAMGELWRVLASGGVLVVMCTKPEKSIEAIGRMESLGCEGFERLQLENAMGWVAAWGRKPGKKPERPVQRERDDPSW